jgi:hypothetical protein
MKTSDFKKGMRVRYYPHHVAYGDSDHRDVQWGAVSSTNDRFVFVKYDCAACTMITGDEPYTAAATDPNQLEVVNG